MVVWFHFAVPSCSSAWFHSFTCFGGMSLTLQSRAAPRGHPRYPETELTRAWVGRGSAVPQTRRAWLSYKGRCKLCTRTCWAASQHPSGSNLTAHYAADGRHAGTRATGTTCGAPGTEDSGGLHLLPVVSGWRFQDVIEQKPKCHQFILIRKMRQNIHIPS
jgi:hypothetical protein